MKRSDLYFNLPEELIAQQPVHPAHEARLLVLDKAKQAMQHGSFKNLCDFLLPSDVLIFNDSKVLPARLVGTKPTGGKVEILLIRKISENHWEAMVKYGAENMGKSFTISQNLSGTIESKFTDSYVIHFSLGGNEFIQEILKIGTIPTPPYITEMVKESDYQNVFARDEKLGSVAAPTAGLHFTNELLDAIKAHGNEIAFVTLHVGMGTFMPVHYEDLSTHKMHTEHFEVPPTTLELIRKAKSEGRRVIAVGTTVCRTLESIHDIITSTAEINTPIIGETDIFITPGYEFKIIDALITNFHTPYSTLLALVMAFGGKEFMIKAYEEAIKERYRFYSLGDGMLIN